MKQQDYIDEFLEYQENQYSPREYYPPQGQLPRFLKYSDQRPLGTAVLTGIQAAVCVLAVYLILRDGLDDKSNCFVAILIGILAILYFLATVNYMRKYFRAKREKEARKAAMKAERKRRKKHKKHG